MIVKSFSVLLVAIFMLGDAGLIMATQLNGEAPLNSMLIDSLVLSDSYTDLDSSILLHDDLHDTDFELVATGEEDEIVIQIDGNDNLLWDNVFMTERLAELSLHVSDTGEISTHAVELFGLNELSIEYIFEYNPDAFVE